MHTDQLLKYITDPEKMDMLSLEQLEAIIRTYPYFQAARVLYLKNLCILRSPRFREELERNIVYITDKRKLFLYLDSESYSWMNLLRNSDSQKNEDVRSSAGFELVETFLRHANKEYEAIELESIILSEVPQCDVISQIENIQQDDAVDTGSVQSSEKPEASVSDSIIDNFLNSGTQISIKPVEPSMPEMAVATRKNESLTKDEGFLTESLAKIYIKQKKYAKALEIIKKLSLKYPEKNVYFADQIRFLEKIISNIKTE